MKWPWQRTAEAKAETDEARAEYEQTLQTGGLVSEVLSVLFFHADQNGFTEKIHRVAKGH